ncbi:PDR/VanB family oxidoreductase [Hydrogenophaga sp.]|uniref:PDR/VanB family oxidoreductase n=1 Tax=Hydrogenophaga sp. TaxID=1904254 RepID=UPI00286E961A|nr:PDR/VanB family oxidoreductase [Hydrogenophaga sp.]
MSTPAAELAVRVARKQTEALDICSLDLVAADGAALPAFEAGAHVDVHLPNGLVRQYSLCNPPGETGRYQIAVLRDAASRGGSQAVHEAVAEGATLRIGAPKNHFPLAASAPHHLLLAGGIGITPMLAMAEQLSAQGQPFALHHCTRSRERTPFVDRMAAAAFAGQVQHHFDDGDAAQKLDISATLQRAPAGTHLYVCGPQGFMDAVLAAGRAAGWPEERLHREYFAAAPVDHSNDGSFELEIASSGRVIPVRADQSALAALLAAGFDIPMSCEQGVCGTCLTRVKAGTPDHHDQYLTPEEQAANDQFLPCCSRAQSPRLVLDL